MALITTPATEKSRTASANQVGLVPTASGALAVTADEYGVGVVRTTRFTLNGSILTTVDTPGTSGNASVQLYTFPKGMTHILGTAGLLTSIVGGAGLTATSALIVSMGTVTAAADATLTSTEANVVPSTTATLASNAAANISLKSLTGASNGAAINNVFDGTSTAINLFLNFATVDAGSTAATTLTVTGFVDVTWMSYGTNAATLT